MAITQKGISSSPSLRSSGTKGEVFHTGGGLAAGTSLLAGDEAEELGGAFRAEVPAGAGGLWGGVFMAGRGVGADAWLP